MRVLFVDDSKNRTRQFTMNMIGAVIDTAENPRIAIDLLSKNKYDVVFLDYDMDEEHTGVNGYGHDITEYICREPKAYSDTLFVVHSLNKDGGKRMVQELGNGKLPTHWEPGIWPYISPLIVTNLVKRYLGKQDLR